MSIEDNVARRLTAKELVDFLEQVADEADDALELWEVIVDVMRERGHLECLAIERDAEVEKPLTDKEKKRFEKTYPPRGKHSRYGDDPMPVGEIPLAYLIHWFERDEWTKKLGRYLRSPGVWSEQNALF